MKKEKPFTCRECHISLSVLTSLDYQGYCASCAKKLGDIALLPQCEASEKNSSC